MSLSSEKRKGIRDFIIMNVREHPSDIVKIALGKFGVSRTAIMRYLNQLQKEKIIIIKGQSRNRTYELLPSNKFQEIFPITPSLAEDKIWREKIFPLLNDQRENVINICEYGFTEIFNNAIDHSEGTKISVRVAVYPDEIQMVIQDDGIGIFNKIQKICQLDDPYHAILELSKGKLTTNPETHTGEGIFFTSRMFDIFGINSHNLFFGSKEKLDFLLEVDEQVDGTKVTMGISTQSAQTTSKVFNEFAGSTHGFDRTVVPVRLVRYGSENLISRSQAKRMLNRLDKFKTIVLDFESINQIGRAFADEVFRVFAVAHPDIRIFTQNSTKEIDDLINSIQQNKSD